MGSDSAQLDPLEIDVELQGPDTAVMLAGELDLVSQGPFWQAFCQAVELGHGSVVLDLSRLTFLDAAGLRSLLDAHSLAGERLIVRAPSPPAQRLLGLTGLDQRLAVQVDPGKVAYVRSLWSAFLTGGPPAMAEMVPDRVEWVPWASDGRVLRGTREMREFWSGRGASSAQAVSFTQVGGDVVIELHVPLPAGRHRSLWSVYHFAGTRLVQAVTFGDRAAAFKFAI